MESVFESGPESIAYKAYLFAPHCLPLWGSNYLSFPECLHLPRKTEADGEGGAESPLSQA